MSSSSESTKLFSTTSESIPENAFYTIIWLGVFLSTTALAFRIYIRISCMRRLHSSDHMMALALALQLAFAGVGQAFLSDIYLMTRVQNGVVTPGADFLDRMTMGLRADGVMLVLSNVGIWVIKMNFLLFFYRLGRHITVYLVFWWVSVVVVIGCGAAAIGMLPFGCMFGDIMSIITKCSSDESVGGIYTRYKVSVVVDCVSDALIICFPISILLKTRISLRQKIILSSIFCLVGFTIGVTVVRGSIFGGVYKELPEVDHKVIDTVWALFWYYVEFMVSFIVACLVSFRSLWAHNDAKARARARDEMSKAERIRERTPDDPSGPGSAGFRAKMRRLHDTLLDTFNDDETLWERDVLPNGPPSAKLSVDFSTYPLLAWDNASACNTHVERTRADSTSVRSLQPAMLADHRV
ncbi:hypothetical protein C8A05DRAFT_46059 [Staphylotrichum tortipilum]|uniref:Rhodopsin domain-containing protein n=1 Tax=Staphylotrichum tortipilum TaxID=2831512 RepID=A0AAN6RRP0_9PEZI|nr:hypothetical protein C8A05DRAFT_46059 [Staphylotrichum longicolle]